MASSSSSSSTPFSPILYFTKSHKNSIRTLQFKPLLAKKHNDTLTFNILEQKGVKPNPIPPQNSLENAIFKALQKSAMLMSSILFLHPHQALATSGGRIGGNSFSSSRPTESIGLDSKILSNESSIDRVRLESSQTYHTSIGFDSFSGGFRGGRVYGAPAIDSGSGFLFVVMSFIGFVLVSGFLSDRSAGTQGALGATLETTVVKLQVGLLGMARSLQRDLNRIAEAADTSSPEGLHFVLTETILALLRHPNFCISAYSSVDVKRSIDEVEKRFNQLSVEERGKFDEETLVNVNNIRKQTGTSQRATGFSNEYIVITILVAVEGVHKFPTISSSRDLKDALHKLASSNSSRTIAVEVLWTPQSENDTLSERELLEDYPLLCPL